MAFALVPAQVVAEFVEFGAYLVDTGGGGALRRYGAGGGASPATGVCGGCCGTGVDVGA